MTSAIPRPAVLDEDAPPPAAAAGSSLATAGRGAAGLNAAAIVVAALYFGRDLLVPMVLAVLLAFVLAPLVALLQRARIGKAPAVLVAVALAFAVILGIGTVVGRQATSLAEGFPAYQATIQDKVKSLSVGAELIGRLNSSLQATLTGTREGPPAVAAPAPAFPAPAVPAPAVPAPAVQVPGAVPSAPAAPAQPVPVPSAGTDPGLSSALGLVRSVAGPVFGPLATMGVVIVFLLFVLLYREDLRDRLVRLVGRQDLHRTILAMNDAAGRLSRYFLFQLALNVTFGVCIGLGLWAIGLPNPVLWGIVAALMRFVPYIGSIIALAPPFLLALAAAPGWSLAFLVLGMFILADLLMGQVIEPLLYGHSTGLSPIAVVLSAAFWVFLWGPVGLLIATPLTVCLVVAGRYVAPLAFLEVILSDSPPLTPPETFYQRALEGNAAELAAQADKAMAAGATGTGTPGHGTLAEYYDRVALRGLALAQADLSRDALAFERLEAIHVQIEALLRQLARRQGAAGDAVPPDWQADGAIVCVPARGQLDDLAATMAMQALQGAGFGARQESNLVLGASRAGEADFGAVRLCCLSVLDQGSSPSGLQYLLRRIQRRMPNAAVVVGLWHAAGDSTLLAALRAEGSEETIVLSLGELVALARAVSARAPAAALPA